jgi:rRNA maturation endonuclease Nob1
LLIGFLIAPLRRPTEETPALNRAASGAAEERDAVLESIRSLDEDFEMGKLTETDHREMRLALRAEAVNLLRLEREAVSERRAEATDPRLCSGCGADVASGSRFCAQCGTSLVERNTAGGDDAA